MPKKALPTDFKLVLRWIAEHGQEELTSLAETLRLEHGRLLHIVRCLQHKGLVKVSGNSWITLSSKGRRAMIRFWPESKLA